MNESNDGYSIHSISELMNESNDGYAIHSIAAKCKPERNEHLKEMSMFATFISANVSVVQLHVTFSQNPSMVMDGRDLNTI